MLPPLIIAMYKQRVLNPMIPEKSQPDFSTPITPTREKQPLMDAMQDSSL
jgi:hypothetical protein